MVNFILPLQPNKLEILKFENYYFQKTTNDDGCMQIMNLKKLVEIITGIRNNWYSTIKKQALVFKYHVKLSHSDYDTKCELPSKYNNAIFSNISIRKYNFK